MPPKPEILCIGGAVVDRKFVLAGIPVRGSSNPATSTSGFGGVARNVCENLARLGISTALATRVGTDAAGTEMLRQLASLAVDISRVMRDARLPTAEYVAVLSPHGALELGLADMAIFDRIKATDFTQGELPTWLFADCNLPAAELAALLMTARERNAKLVVDCVSVAKSARLPLDLAGVHLLFANAAEAEALLGEAMPPEQAANSLRSRGAAAVIVTLGAGGLILEQASHTLHLTSSATDVVDVTGAGDALIAATLAALLRGADLPDAARHGMEAAAVTLGSTASVRADLAAAMAARGAA